MREIKFRYTCLRKNGYGFSRIFTLDEIENGDVKRWDEANITATGSVYKDQFTGLKDKNGTEIYEGDILNCCGRKKYKPSEAVAIHIYELGGKNRGIPCYCANGMALANDDILEVIGNIYQHPHLIQQ